MPALSEVRAEIQREIQEAEKRGESDLFAAFAAVRRRYASRLAELTGNNVAVYAAGFVQNPNAANLTIGNTDVPGFMDILHKMDGNAGLDLILHSPGGSPEAAEGIADYLHHHFAGRRIRVIVPHMAMSAATMLACAADSVMMGEHSSLGPIDPQVAVRDGADRRRVAAHAILQEFGCLRRMGSGMGADRAREFSARYPLGLINECRNVTKMCERLARYWLLRRMFQGDENKEENAETLAKYLANHGHFKSHSRRISIKKAREMKMRVERLEDDCGVQDAVLSVFHALCLTFSHTPVSKIIENHNGRLFIQDQ